MKKWIIKHRISRLISIQTELDILRDIFSQNKNTPYSYLDRFIKLAIQEKKIKRLLGGK